MTTYQVGRLAILGIFALGLGAGCGGSGSGQIEGPPTAPVISSANQDQLAKDVNAGAGAIAKGSPGVKK